MADERFRVMAAVYLLFMEGDRIMLLRRYNTGYADGQYSLIAGHIDGDEPLRMAMVREAMEEAGISIEPSSLDLVHVLHRFTPAPDGSPDERVEFFFTPDRWEGTPRIMEPDKCDDLSWFPLDELPAETLDYVRHVVSMVREGIAYSEYGWP